MVVNVYVIFLLSTLQRGGHARRRAHLQVSTTSILCLWKSTGLVTLCCGPYYRELVVGFLSDRTRLLVTHNMSLAVGAADLVVCLDMCTGPTNSQLHSSAQAKSRVLACCPPADLPGVIQQLRSLHSSGHGKSQTGFALQPVEEGDPGDLSVFMEGLVAAISSGKTDVNEECKDGNAEAHTPMSNATTAVGQALFIDTSVDGSTAGSAKTTSTTQLSPAPSVKEPSRSLRQNNSFKSLSKGHTAPPPLTPDRKTAADSGVSFKAVQGGAEPVYTADSSAGCDPSTGDPGAAKASSGAEAGKIVHVESKSVGHVGWSTYWFYFKACGGVRAVVGILGGTALCAAAW
jgi:hypothetical protein